MTREKALEAMDKLVAMGYHVSLSERDLGQSYVNFDQQGFEQVQRWLEISAISLDKVDLRALVAAADELGLDVGFSPIQGGKMSLTDPPSAADQRRAAVVSGKRRHPR